MKLSILLKTAAAGLFAANFSAQEAKAQSLGDLLQEGLRQYQENQDRNGGGGFRFDPPGGGRNRSCQQDWYLSNGNRGGTFDPCNGETMPRGGYSDPGQQAPQGDFCYGELKGRSVTGYSRDCQSNPKRWNNLQYE